jgi:D-alanyl-D-alanine carboxypeptidase
MPHSEVNCLFSNPSRFLSASLLTTPLFFLLVFFDVQGTQAQSLASLEERISRVTSRAEFARSNFGIEFYDLETGKVVYALNTNKLFVPASTTKLLTEGTLLANLGLDYRFHTLIYRTGPIDKHGTLKGNLVLVASGDPNLSNRIQADGTLAFVDEDHSYNGPALPGDPLAVIKDFAAQVAAKGIRKIEGRVYIDTSLMPDGEREGGTGVTMSSIMVNDNIIDLTATAGAKVGDPVAFGISPQTSYFHFVNAMTTGLADSKVSFDATDPATFRRAAGCIRSPIRFRRPRRLPHGCCGRRSKPKESRLSRKNQKRSSRISLLSSVSMRRNIRWPSTSRRRSAKRSKSR